MSATRWYSFAGKLVAHRTGNGLAGVTSVVTDPQGSVVGTVHNTDWASGVVRKRPDPFGGARSTTSVTSQGRGFLGAVHDSNALVLLGARYFDPGSGVFVSVDPLLDPGNPAQFNAYPAQFNAYVYAGNNPATWSDPSGLMYLSPRPDGGGGYRGKGAVVETGKGGASGGTGKATSTSSHSSTNGRCGYADWDCRAQAASEEVSCGGVGKGRYCKSTPGAGPWGYSYQYDHKLKLSKPTTAEQAMAAFQANPSTVFPFKVGGCDRFYTGAECVLETGATLNPNGTVGVTTTSTSVKFTVIARGYFDAPGSTVEFSTWSDDAGSTYLRQTASAHGTSLDTMIAVGVLQLAKPTWEQQAANLGAVINEQR